MKHTQPVKKNDDITLTIDAYTSDGAGIGRIENFAVFVPGALIGETVDAHIIKVTSSYAVGKLITVISPNKVLRSAPVCPVCDKCGGCDMQHMTYEAQLDFKRDRVKNALSRIGGADVEIPAVIPSVNTVRYRNKASFPFGNVDGRVRLGFYAHRSHRLIPTDDCAVQKEETVTVLRTAESWANTHGISAYDEEKGDGILRHLVVRATSEGVLVCVVTSGNALPYADELAAMLKTELEKSGTALVGLVHNINPKATNVILGTKYRPIAGRDDIDEEISGMSFRVRTPSFLQVNHEQTEKLYATALDMLRPEGSENIFDIYCGIGTITLMAAKSAGHVTGIEYVQESVDDAKYNAVKNGIQNVSFYAGAAERILPELVEHGRKADAVILDPPRAGADKDVLTAIAQSGAKRVVYVSCNPETLARDIKLLAEHGYRVEKVQPVDMFPQTAHVETVVLMSKK